MARQTNNISQSTRKRSLKNKTKLGLSLIVIFSVVFVMLAFNIVTPLTSLVLGLLGLLTFPLLLSGVFLGILLMLDRSIYLEKQDILFLLLWLVTFVSIVHLATTVDIIDYNFTQYLSNTFNYKVSAGGLVFSIIIYMFYAMTHTVATFVLFTILLVALSVVIIDRLIIYKQLNKLNYGNRKSDIDISKSNIKTDKHSNTPSVVEPQQSTLSNDNIVDNEEEDVIISDESFDALKNETEFSKLSIKEKIKAKQMLGLSEKEKQVNKNILKNTKDNNIYNYEKAKNSGVNKKDYILTPTSVDSKNSNSDSRLDALRNKNVEQEDGQRPPKYVHNTNIGADNKKYEDALHSLKITKELSEADRKNIEYLHATHGKYYENRKTKVVQQPSNVDNSNEELDIANKKPQRPTLHIEDDYLEQELNSGLYDEELTSKNYKSYNYNNNNDDNNDNDSSQYNEQVDELVDEEPKAEYKSIIDDINATNAPSFVNSNNNSNNVSKPVRRYAKYNKPTLDLLKVYRQDNDQQEDYSVKAQMLEDTLASFKIPAKVISVTRGPAFTRFELQMPQGISVKKVASLDDDISMILKAQGAVRIETPIPGKNAFGVEVPNDMRSTVGLRNIIESYSFEGNKSKLAFALGVDITGESKVSKLEKMPHLLVAGSTGSGKSVCLNTLIISLLYKSSPEDLRILLIDPKRVEFSLYNGLPHLLIPNVITEPDKAILAFAWLIEEMERRFTLFANNRVRNLDEYNDLDDVKSYKIEKLPFIVVVVDELADLMSINKKDLEDKIIRIAQKSRAAGIHLVLATQRPSVDVITGIIKSNLPSRISFAVSSFVDSKTIIDRAGAEKLLGKGDMLYSPIEASDPIRLQGAFISNQEVNDVIDYVKDNNEVYFDSDIEDQMFNKKSGVYDATGANMLDEFDPLIKDVARLVVKTNKISISKVQRMFGIGYPKAGRIVDQMVKAGFISEPDDSKNRAIFITKQEFEEKFGEEL